MMDFFQNIFGAIISAMASVIIAVGLVSVPEVPKPFTQIERPKEESIIDKIEPIKIEQKNEKQNELPKPIISEQPLPIPKQKTTTAEERRKMRFGEMEDAKKREIQTLLQEFIDTQTRESLLILCDKASLVEIPYTEKIVLSPDRTTTIKVQYTLFDIMKCDLISNQYYSFLNTMPELFQWNIKDDDSDTMRIRKIEYSKRIKEFLSSGKFVIVEKALIPSVDNLTGHLITNGENYTFSFWAYNPMIRAIGILKDPNSARFISEGSGFWGETLSAVVVSP